MDESELFRGLQFERSIRWPSARTAAVGLGVLVYVLAWAIFSPTAIYWLGMPLVAALMWAASYGWRQAVIALIAFLERLLQF